MNWQSVNNPPKKDSFELLGWVNVGKGSVAYIVSYIDGVWGGFPKELTITHWCEILAPIS